MTQEENYQHYLNSKPLPPLPSDRHKFEPDVPLFEPRENRSVGLRKKFKWIVNNIF